MPPQHESSWPRGSPYHSYQQNQEYKKGATDRQFVGADQLPNQPKLAQTMGNFHGLAIQWLIWLLRIFQLHNVCANTMYRSWLVDSYVNIKGIWANFFCLEPAVEFMPPLLKNKHNKKSPPHDFIKGTLQHTVQYVRHKSRRYERYVAHPRKISKIS